MTSRSLVIGNLQARERQHSNDSREVVRAASHSLQNPPGQNLQALITSLEQIELRLQRTEEQSDIRDAETKKAIEDIDARQTKKLQDSEARLTQQMQHSIASTLQEQANNAAKQTRISALLSSLERAKAKYDDAASVLDAEKDIMAGIENDPNIAEQERRDVAKNIYRAQMTVDQRAKALHLARAELCTHGPALSLDPDTILPNYDV